MILNESVEIVLNPRYIKYWEDKGYFIPREIDPYGGGLTVKRDAKIVVDIRDLSKNSHALVSCQCVICGNIRDIKFNQYREVCGECNNKIRCGEKHPSYGSKISKAQLAKTKETKIKKGTWISDDMLDEFSIYRRCVKIETNKWKFKLFESWNGLDYYTGEKLITNIEYIKLHPNTHVNRNKLQPTIDHKISVYNGFVNNINPNIIGNINNLCICSKIVNSTKNRLSESQYTDIIKLNRR